MDTGRLTILLEGYWRRNLTTEEEQELAALIMRADEETLDAAMEPIWMASENRDMYIGRSGLSAADAEAILARILPKRGRVVRFGRRSRWAAAAAVLVVAVGIWYLQNARHVTSPELATHAVVQDIPAPTGSQTTLTLDNGQQLVLDSLRTGRVGNQGAADVSKQNGGLSYRATGGSMEEVYYNTLTTARGGQTQVTLADGTRVWLNATSSLHYPTTFAGKDRVVELQGEAYFEVSPDAQKPFYVRVNNSQVRVLGTHFNIMAYTDEGELRTTLLEGAVEFDGGGAHQRLVPGEQAILIAGTGGVTVRKDVDPDAVLAWKRGYFQFNSMEIPAILREIRRWYDVDIVYNGKIPAGHFSGIVSRSDNISAVLKIMAGANVHFTIRGKTITLEP